MAQYLIAIEDDGGEFVREVEAKNIKEAARSLIGGDDADDGFTAKIWRVAGPPKTVTLRVETSVSVEVT
jgi:hypothetical protein